MHVLRWPAILICLIGAVALFLILFQYSTPDTPAAGRAEIGGAFTLIGTQGQIIKDGDFRGKLMLVYMGYSNCPNICPMTLSTLSRVLALLGNEANKVAAIFITLDPARDTPQVLAKYLGGFDARIIGLTGAESEILKTVQAYKAYSEKITPPHADGYLIDHSGFIYLMDRNGQYLTHFQPGAKAEQIAEVVRAVLKEEDERGWMIR